MAPELDPTAVASAAMLDQSRAMLRDTIDDALQIVTYHTTLRQGGVPVALSARLTEEYQRAVLWPAPAVDGVDD